MSVSDCNPKVRYLVRKAIDGVLLRSELKAYVMLRPGIKPYRNRKVIDFDGKKGNWVIHVDHERWGPIKIPLECEGEFEGLPQYQLASDSTRS